MPRYSDQAVAANRERSRGPARERYRHGGREERLNNRQFIGWDGEGYRAFSASNMSGIVVDHRYMLFGNSLGYAETGQDLSTKQCLELIIQTEKQYPDAFHVGFAFDYDVNMILRDLTWPHLAVLHDAGKAHWKGYRIEHIPHKMFKVSAKDATATIYDAFGFFHCAYIKAIEKYKCGTQEQRDRIAAGKAMRAQFTWAQIKQVTRYMFDELELMPELMEHVRESLYSAGFFITQWHGPGAVASFALKVNGVSKLKPKEKEVPVAVRVARTLAYAGGRFQSWRGGLYLGPVYTADINSAYAYAVARLPNLATGHWVKRDADTIHRKSDIGHFALYRVRYRTSGTNAQKAIEHGIPFPLFHRDKSGHLTWPHDTETWCWSPEAANLAGNPDAEFLEAWEFIDDGTRPFRWIESAYERRISLPAGHPARDAYKWALASIYGSFARRVGWDRANRTAPRTHQLEWAGYITSYCRAMVWQAALDVARRNGLISIDTDGVTSLVPFSTQKLPNGESTALGAWKLDTYSGILHWQNGFYWLRDMEKQWIVPKTRGIPKGSLSIQRAFDAIEYSGGLTNFDQAVIKYQRTRFTGYSQALQHRYGEWRHWFNEPVQIRFGGAGKGTHIPQLCSLCQGKGPGRVSEDKPSYMAGNPMHTITNIPPNDPLSQAHKLPWLEPVSREEYGESLIFPDELVGEL